MSFLGDSPQGLPFQLPFSFHLHLDFHQVGGVGQKLPNDTSHHPSDDRFPEGRGDSWFAVWLQLPLMAQIFTGEPH